MKIAFISYENINDPFLWSGIPYTLLKKFKSIEGIEIKAICTNEIPIKYPLTVLIKRFFYNKIMCYRFGVYRFDREDWLIKVHAKFINKALLEFNPDVILCCTAYQINRIEIDKPIFIYTDATFKQLNTHYTDYKRYANESVKQAQRVEKAAFITSQGLIFSSNWAKQSAIVDYAISAEKISVIPFGSNLKLPDNYQLKLHKEISRDHFKMVFVGYDYKRKGLSKAVVIHQKLLAQGINSKLLIIGPEKLPEEFHLKGIDFLGKLEMKNPEDCMKLIDTYDEAHFLILPTMADCTPIVFSEAASLALPVITHAIGGIDEIIKNEINGIKLPTDSDTDLFVEKLIFYIENKQTYQNLRMSTHKEYDERLNWDITVKRLLSLFNHTSIK